jgi:hypothetical protein
MQQMMTNLECSQAESNGTMSIEDQARSADKCTRRYILGLEKLVADFRALKWKARDTDAFVTITQETDKLIIDNQQITALYSELTTKTRSQNDEDATTTTIITNLVNMHASLVGINALIEKRIPMMQKNCMKGSPGVVGGCY